MRQLTLYEHDRLYAVATRSDSGVVVSRRLFERLRNFDLSQAEKAKDTIFDWSYRDFARARNWVGVLAVDDVQIEILPKIEAPRSRAEDESTSSNHVRTSLLHMLRYAGIIKSRRRDLAMLSAKRSPLSELLLYLFGERVRQEVAKGIPRIYREEEGNLRTIRGRIDFRRYPQVTTRRPDMIACRYDAHVVDSPLARLIRATCEMLHPIARTSRTRNHLAETIRALEGVPSVPPSQALADSVKTDRTSAQYVDIVTFCKLVVRGMSPGLRSGDFQSFSLLFPMERVYEGFLEGFFRREVVQRSPELTMRAQGKGMATHLFRDTTSNRPSQRLEPDLIFTRVDATGRTRCVVVDAKWKVPEKRPSRDVLYQMFAYGVRFEADSVVILYPKHLSNAIHRDYTFEGFDRRLLVREVPVGAELQTPEGCYRLRQSLENILHDAFCDEFECYPEPKGAA